MCMAHASTPRRIVSNRDECLLYKTLSFHFNMVISQLHLTRNYGFFFLLPSPLVARQCSVKENGPQWCTYEINRSWKFQY